jgi:Carboxypeptidase regulatory-like domain
MKIGSFLRGAVVLTTALALGVLPSNTAAQSATVSQISGTVQDSTGAVIPAASVTLTNTGTNIARTVQSGATGSYSIGNVQPGPYKLVVKKNGYATYTQSGIVIQVATNPTINVTMKVGAVSQEVVVQEDAAMVETQTTSLGQVIQPEQVVDLPLNGRQPTQLIALSGGAVSIGTSGGLANNLDYPTAVAYAIDGSQGNETNYYLDGSLNMDYRTNIGLPLPFPDALQEFKVETSSLPANAGRAPGGVVSAVTKSGTNQFHGDVFEFLRNTAMDARIAFTGREDQLKRNQFGGVVGGPVIRDKLFFFTGVQGTMERVLGNTVTAYVPTQAMLTGDFSQCSSTKLNNTYTTAPKSNVIDTSKYPLNPVALKIAALLPTPADQVCGQTSYTPFQSDNEWQGIGRVDWQRTANDSYFFRYFITDYFLKPQFAAGNLLTATVPGFADRAQNLDVGETYVISPQMLSSTRLSFGRTATDRLGAPGIPTLPSLGSKMTAQIPDFLGQFIVAGYFNASAPSYPGYDYENIFGITQNLAWNKGRHQFNFGFEGFDVQMNDDGLFQVNGSLIFSSGASSVTGNALADFLTGNIDTFKQGNGQLGRDSKLVPSLYAEDNWKISHNFQINLGVRWDPFYPQKNKYKMASDFNVAAFAAGTQTSTTYVNAPPGVTFPGDKGFNGTSDTNAQPWKFSPRFGIIYDPRGKGLETIRAGYGMFYDTTVLWNTMHVVLNPPWGETLGFTPVSYWDGGANDGGLSNPWVGQAGGNPFPTPLNPPSNFAFPQNGQYIFEDKNIQPTNVQQWNLSFQKQVTPNWMVSATYLGNKTSHLWLGDSLNYAQIVNNGSTGPCTLPYGGQMLTFNQCNGPSTEHVNGVSNEQARGALVQLNPAAGSFFGGGNIMMRGMGNASYNAFMVTAEHRLSNGFSIMGNYTWSHCLDDGEVGQDVTNAFQNPANPKADWGNCSMDRRQLANLSVVAQSHKFSNRATEMILGNWEGSGIFTVTSGQYLNITDGSDISLSGVGLDRPNYAGNPLQAGSIGGKSGCPASVKTVGSWFNKCAFTTQAPQTFGDSHRNSVLGPGNWNLDAAVWKRFPIENKLAFVFRAEAFNAFNHFWMPNPNNLALNSPKVGAITAPDPTHSSRLLQLAAKIEF